MPAVHGYSSTPSTSAQYYQYMDNMHQPLSTPQQQIPQGRMAVPMHGQPAHVVNVNPSRKGKATQRDGPRPDLFPYNCVAPETTGSVGEPTENQLAYLNPGHTQSTSISPVPFHGATMTGPSPAEALHAPMQRVGSLPTRQVAQRTRSMRDQVHPRQPMQVMNRNERSASAHHQPNPQMVGDMFNPAPGPSRRMDQPGPSYQPELYHYEIVSRALRHR
jgi:hypothetical protein